MPRCFFPVPYKKWNLHSTYSFLLFCMRTQQHFRDSFKPTEPFATFRHPMTSILDSSKYREASYCHSINKRWDTMSPKQNGFYNDNNGGESRLIWMVHCWNGRWQALYNVSLYSECIHLSPIPFCYSLPKKIQTVQSLPNLGTRLALPIQVL